MRKAPSYLLLFGGLKVEERRRSIFKASRTGAPTTRSNHPLLLFIMRRACLPIFTYNILLTKCPTRRVCHSKISSLHDSRSLRNSREFSCRENQTLSIYVTR